MKKRIIAIVIAALMTAALIPLGTAVTAADTCTVTFDTLGRGDAPGPFIVRSGQPLIEVIGRYDAINLGSDGGNQFSHWVWYKDGDPEGETEFDPEAPVTQDLTLYPVWKEAIDEVKAEFSPNFFPYAGADIPEGPMVILTEGESRYEIMDAYWCDVFGSPATGEFNDESIYFLRVNFAPCGDRLFRDNDGHYLNDTLAVKSAVLDCGDRVIDANFVQGSKYVAYAYFMFIVGDFETHTVTFDPCGHGDPAYTPTTLTVPNGWSISFALADNLGYDAMENNMFETGWMFLSWYDSETDESFFQFVNQPIYKDTVLKAKWEKADPVDLVELTVSAPMIGESAKSYRDRDPAKVNDGFAAGIDELMTDIERADGKPFDKFKDSFEEGVEYVIILDFYAADGHCFAGGRTTFGYKVPGKLTIHFNNDGIDYIPPIYNTVSFKLRYKIKAVLPFKDVASGKWYTDAIGKSFGRGLMSGTSSDRFSPDSKVTRAMFVTVLAKIAGADTSSYSGSSFSDVPEGKWFSRAVQWAVKNGYTSGLGDGIFGPDENITREQLAQFFFTFCAKKGIDTRKRAEISGYSDASSVSGWAKNAVRWAVASELISGTSKTTLSPGDNATRAQLAVITIKFLDGIYSK